MEDEYTDTVKPLERNKKRQIKRHKGIREKKGRSK